MRTTHLSSRELTTILYALINYQSVCIDTREDLKKLAIDPCFAEHAPLNPDEIDELYKRLSKPEDRSIMEIFLGRKIDKHEAVSHIDGDPTNNDPSNLRVVTLAKNRGNHV